MRTRLLGAAALVQQLSPTELGQPVQLLEDRGLQAADRLLGSAMRTAERFVHDPVDHAQRLQVACCHAHRFRGVGSLVGGAPEDGCATFGRDDRIDCVLEHQDAIGSGNRNGPTRSTLAHHRRDHRNAERQALLGRPGDRFGLAAFFRLDSRESSRRVH